VPLDRVFLLAPKLEGKGDGKAKATRADFALK